MTFQNQHDDLERQLWNELKSALSDPAHGWRTPVLATVDYSGAPDARTVVLRDVDSEKHNLRIYTDRRSPKVKQILGHTEVTLVFWCPKLKWQLRAGATARVNENQPLTERIWTQLRSTASASDYLRMQPPSSPLYAEGLLPEDEHALCIIDFKINALDWLSLNHNRHKRAKIANNTLTWITP